MKVLFASPTYGPIEPICRRTQNEAIMGAARYGTTWLTDASADRMGFMDARNYAVEHIDDNPALREVADGIFWMDSDIKPEPLSIAELLNTATTYNLDFVTGIYHARRGSPKPLIYRYFPDTDKFLQYEIYQRDQIFPVGGCGFGFVWTSTKLLMAIKELPEFSTDRGGWFPDHHYGDVSEDLGFCRYAAKAGFQLYANTAVQVAHQGDTGFITYDNYLKYLGGSEGFTRVEQAGHVSPMR